MEASRPREGPTPRKMIRATVGDAFRSAPGSRAYGTGPWRGRSTAESLRMPERRTALEERPFPGTAALTRWSGIVHPAGFRLHWRPGLADGCQVKNGWERGYWEGRRRLVHRALGPAPSIECLFHLQFS